MCVNVSGHIKVDHCLDGRDVQPSGCEKQEQGLNTELQLMQEVKLPATSVATRMGSSFFLKLERMVSLSPCVMSPCSRPTGGEERQSLAAVLSQSQLCPPW